MKFLQKYLLCLTLFFILLFAGCSNKNTDSGQEPYVTPQEGMTPTPAITQLPSVEVSDTVQENIIPTQVITRIPDEMIIPRNLISSFSTSFIESTKARSENIKNGAALLNGITLKPKETLSLLSVLSPFTKEHGYQVAGTFMDGKIVPSTGGGVCQIASTLYNAALLGDMEIVERHCHSMTVSYVELSRDACIVEGEKDLKIRNNYDSPVTIEAKVNDRTLYISLKTTVEADLTRASFVLEPLILSKTSPGKDVITYDKGEPNTYTKVTQAAHTGYEIELYKVYYENGHEIKRDFVNYSEYKATPQYITIGTMKSK